MRLFTKNSIKITSIAVAMALVIGGCSRSAVGTGTGSGAGSETREELVNKISKEATVLSSYPVNYRYPNEADYMTEDYGYDWEKYDEAYTKWRDAKYLLAREVKDADILRPYLQKSIATFLRNDGRENMIYSPTNVYMALAMLAEVTDGDSRKQILDLLGSKDIDALRSQAKDLWETCYSDDGYLTSKLNSSMWMGTNMVYNKDTLANLDKYYYASSFTGEMGSPKYNELFQSWLNANTGDLLRDQVSDLTFSPNTVIALATTIYFKSGWAQEFPKYLSKEDIFTNKDGDKTCTFMNTSGRDIVYYGDRFMSVIKNFREGYAMEFILPDEGVDVNDLLTDGELLDFISMGHKYEWAKQKFMTVNWSIPKFDVSSQIDLKKGLAELGVRDVMDELKADFTPLGDCDNPIVLSRAIHGARVLVDEEGCEAAAYTVMMAETTSALITELEEIDFVCNRPFIFTITNANGLPIFTGVVNSVE